MRVPPASLALPGPLVTPQWLSERIGSPELVVLDATLGKPGPSFLPGARWFDFDRTICDRESPLPHMMPQPAVFEHEVRKLGIHNGSVVVVYDAKGIYSSPRARWMFKAMGHDTVAVLDGGLPAWVEAGLPVRETLSAAPVNGSFQASLRAALICDAEEVARALQDDSFRVVDARSEGRFFGREAEPRPGLRGGHMPGSVNLPFSAVLEGGRFKPLAELHVILANKAPDRNQLIFSCGSGVTACIPALAAELIGRTRIAIYDGSWSEWGLDSARPVETGRPL